MTFGEIIIFWASFGAIICVVGLAYGGCLIGERYASDVLGGGIAGMALGWFIWALGFFYILSGGVADGSIPR